MKIFLQLDPEFYSNLLKHLFQSRGETEDAAFLCVAPRTGADQLIFEAIDSYFAKPEDFAFHESDYLELTDKARIGLIKRAHGHSASLLEIHSHTGPYQARFSSSDRAGLRDTVPHMWWRLNHRPYIAMVFAKSGFDALVWLDNPHVPRSLDALLVGNKEFCPTNYSIGGWA